MPRWITACFVFVLSLSLLPARARSIDDIIRSYHLAMGANEQIQQREILQAHLQVISDELNVQTGHEPAAVEQANNANLEEQKIRFFMDLLEQFKGRNLFVEGEGLNNASTLEGVSDLEGRPCFMVHTTGNKQAINYFIDARSSYIIREERANPTPNGSNKESRSIVRIDYSDYKKNHQGYVFPYRIHAEGLGTCLFSEITIHAAAHTTKSSQKASSAGKLSNQ